MARHLDELLGAQDAMDRRHERWRDELRDLFADMEEVLAVPLLAAASTGVVAPEEGRDPHPWKAQADGLGGFRASMLEEELRVKEPPPAWMSEAAPLSPPPKRPPPPPPNQGERKAPAQQPTKPPPALPVVSKLERAASTKKPPPPPPRGDHPQDVIPGPSSVGASLAAGGPRGDHPRGVIPGSSAGDALGAGDLDLPEEVVDDELDDLFVDVTTGPPKKEDRDFAKRFGEKRTALVCSRGPPLQMSRPQWCRIVLLMWRLTWAIPLVATYKTM